MDIGSYVRYRIGGSYRLLASLCCLPFLPTATGQGWRAAFLDIDTRVYTVKGYLPTFRLAAYLDGMLQLYEADTNPCARTGADLLRHRWEGSLHWHH